MKNSILLSFILLLINQNAAFSQMIENGNIKYGNEWIDFEKDYYKIPISADGLYTLSYQDLLAAGIESSELVGANFKIHEFGEEIPLFVSTESQFGNQDYILFYGKQNRGEIDKYLYEDQEGQLNPYYSLFTDTLNYFLSIHPDEENLRYDLVENDLTGNLPFVEDFYWHEEKIVNSSNHFKPTYDGTNKVTYSHLDLTEGFTSPMQKYNEYTIPISNFTDIGEDPLLKFRISTSTSPHKTEVSVNGDLKDILYATSYTVTEQEMTIAAEEMEDEIVVSFNGINVTTSLIDRNAQSYVSITYPRTFSFEGNNFIQFNVEAKSFPSYFEISSLDLDQGNVMLFDLTNQFILIPEWKMENDLIRFKLPPSNVDRSLVICNIENAPVPAGILPKVELIDYSNFDEEYIIISNKALFKNHNGENQVQAYADYRSSDEGGNYKSIIVEVQQIYDQFGYGIHRHSQSLNNFVAYVADHWTDPQLILIIGKGRDYIETRTRQQLEDPSNLFFVPTYGYHGADVLIAAPKGESTPMIPVGRIATKTPEQIEEYLEKVKRHENYLKYAQNLEEKEWMKKIIHLSGGDANIQDLLRNYLDEMGAVLENNYFGANVVTYGRTSGSATETVTEKIVEDINEGASIITFFGHSGVSTSDFNIGELQNEKFPLFISLGCYSGDIHTSITNGQSEKFVLSPHGVIGFLGAAGTAYITPQYSMGKALYGYLGGELYGKSIGESIKSTLDLNKDNQSLSIKSLNQQMTLHGDPAVKLNPHDGPDYVCDYETVGTNPDLINSNDEAFVFNLDIVNLGRWVDDSLGIQIIREFPNGNFDTTYTRIPGPKYRSTLSVSLPTGKIDGIGENCIYVNLDYDQKFEEKLAPEAENNNQLVNDTGEAGYCFHIINNGAKPIYPLDFSIVNKEEIILKASTYNYFNDPQKFYFQIDTTELFNSPLFLEHYGEFEGGLIEWKPGMDPTTETVYYWRISPDTLNSVVGFVWSTNSFIYLPESSEGWNQSHKYQYEKDEGNSLEVDGWNLDYADFLVNVEIKNKKFDPTDPNICSVNGAPWGTFNPISLRSCIAVIGVGPNKLNDFPEQDFGTFPNGGAYSYIFKTTTQDQRKGIKPLLEAMPDSATVYIFNYLDETGEDFNPETWAQDSVDLGYNIFSVLEEYGATQVRELEQKGAVPYTFIFKKGGEVLDEKIGNSIDDVIESNVISKVKHNNGTLTSTLIGPAINWNKIEWSETLDDPEEISFLTIYGLNQELEKTLIKDSLIAEYSYDISDIDTEEFPFLELNLYSKDRNIQSPPELHYWRVIYQGLPDAVLVMDEFSEFYKDTLDFGDDFRFKATVLNNSSIDMDSMEVSFTVKKSNNNLYSITKKFKPLLANDTIHISFLLETDDFAGINEFTVEVNPDHQPEEQFYFNNIGIKRFFVGSDRENPLLDVTFDGIHIMDGDIVSPRPEINMMLKDENPHLLMNDPNVFTKINLITPSNETIEIPVGSELLEFIPAENTSDNVAEMIFRPELNEEGEYSLIVQAKDISNNVAGANEYQVDFMVILDDQISNVYNYPNPFSNSTQFVFTLTGYEVPEDMIIRIMTLSGKVVREITKDELGPLRIGNNITEYHWDGRDEYGDKLGNGVYLYQVKAKSLSGEDYKLFETGENDSKFFKKGWGKMAILR